MLKKRLSIEEAVASYDRASAAEHIGQGQRELEEVTARFPLDAWPTMPLERYALGQESSDETFCQWMEFRTPHLGSIRGGSARKLIIYKHRGKPGWYFDPEYRDEQEAWTALRQALVHAFEKARAGDWDSIDDLAPLSSGPAIRLKALRIYFPSDVLPIASKQHLRHFLGLLDRPEASDHNLDVVRLNRALLDVMRQRSEFEGWSTAELERFLYYWADPRDQRRVVRVTPGEDARYWDGCLRGGYICVGWDEVGDLREFESKDAFRERFVDAYGEQHNHHGPMLTRKANELWTLNELEPGDIVIANKGTSEILGVGTVVEPGYLWAEDRPEARHTVRVDWDTSFARTIAPQKQWAFVTVAPVSASLYETIMAGKAEAVPPPVEPLLAGIGEALERKGQVILYGPPGTGKTYHARRFAVAWLLQRLGRTEDAQAVLGDSQRFLDAERELSRGQIKRRVWWIVANPREWSWSRLFEDGQVSYRHGRLQRNYPHVKSGDLVVGYQSTPDKRIVALARVSRGFASSEGAEPTIEIVPVTKVDSGPTYDELAADPVLVGSEPMRFRNQGTLFSLTDLEADHLLSLLSERSPAVQDAVGADANVVSPLTRVTFHPSYTYEDFIEGFRPYDTGDRSLSLRLEDGIFKRVCLAALEQPKKPFVLLIDEINRANVAKVFGELITLLEIDKRGLSITLPQSKESFSIPPNVYLLGTMNTADRSIKLLDAALRRRFAFIELMPDVEVLRGARVGTLALDTFLEELNRRIARTEGREKQIGHSFPLEKGEPITDADEFGRRFRQEILPLLQEYCYDDYAALETYVGAKLVRKEAQTLDWERLADSDALIASLEEELVRSAGAPA